jgi:hypothetical protein
LRAFADAQREADRARIRSRYTDREDGFERVRALFGEDGASPGDGTSSGGGSLSGDGAPTGDRDA